MDGPAPWSERLGRATYQTLDDLASVAAVALSATPGRHVAALGAQTTQIGASAVVSTSKALVPYYPLNNGFWVAPVRTLLQPGQLIDRFGGSAVSRFFSPAGTAIATRALPPATAAMKLRTFEVIKAVEVDAGIVAPAFGTIGSGSQYRTTLTLQELLEQGFIREIVR